MANQAKRQYHRKLDHKDEPPFGRLLCEIFPASKRPLHHRYFFNKATEQASSRRPLAREKKNSTKKTVKGPQRTEMSLSQRPK
jgi:hypothetical protein